MFGLKLLQICAISIHLKLCLATAIHNFKWVFFMVALKGLSFSYYQHQQGEDILKNSNIKR